MRGVMFSQASLGTGLPKCCLGEDAALLPLDLVPA